MEVTRQEIILRTAPYGFFREGFVIVTAEDQNRDIGRGGEHLVERLDILAIGQGQFEQDSINSSFAQPLKTRGKLANPFHVARTAACRGELRANPISGTCVVFNQND